MSTWPHDEEWLEAEYAKLGDLAGEFELESVGAPINPGGFPLTCPGCGSDRTAFGSSVWGRDNRWVCTTCGLVFDLEVI